MKKPRGRKCLIAITFVFLLGLSVPLWAGGQQPRQAPTAAATARVRFPFRYKICTVSDIGFAKCITSGKLASFISSELTKAQAELVRSILDAFIRDHGIGPNDLLVQCGNQWRSVDASFVQANVKGPGSIGFGPGASLSPNEQRSVVAACSGQASDVGVDLTGGGSGGGSGRTHSDYVNSILDQVDGAFSGCKEDPLKPVEMSDVEKEYIRLRGVPVEKIPGTNIPNPAGRHWDANAYSEAEIAAKFVWYKVLISLGEFAKEANEQREAAELEQIRRQEELEAQQRAEERAQQEADGRASEEEEQASQQCLEGTACADPKVPTASYPGPDGGSTCAQRAAAWSRFKTSCDRSGWREFRCENFIRTLAGCADITKIRPGPDGDNTCNAQPTKDAERRLLADKGCEQRSGLALVGERGQSLCAKPSLGGAFRLPSLDICSDPVARTTSDQCRQMRVSEMSEVQAAPARQMQNRQNTQTRPNP